MDQVNNKVVHVGRWTLGGVAFGGEFLIIHRELHRI